VIEIDQVLNPHQQQLDLTWHTRGKSDTELKSKIIDSPLQGPLARMKACRTTKVAPGISTFSYDVDQDIDYRQHFYNEGEGDWLTGIAPDNPATSDLSYLLLRSQQKQLRNLLLHDLDGSYQLLAVEWQETINERQNKIGAKKHQFADALEIKYSHGEEVFILFIDFEKGNVRCLQNR